MKYFATLSEGKSYTIGTQNFVRGIEKPVTETMYRYLETKGSVFKLREEAELEVPQTTDPEVDEVPDSEVNNATEPEVEKVTEPEVGGITEPISSTEEIITDSVPIVTPDSEPVVQKIAPPRAIKPPKSKKKGGVIEVSDLTNYEE
jgi:hypothetical protein